MNAAPRILILSASLSAALLLSACGKKDDSAPAAPASPATAAAPAPAPTPPPAAATTPAPAATLAPASAPSVDSVNLGSSVDASNKVGAPTTSFTPKDTIYASVSVIGSGPAKVDAKWSYQNGQTVKEDSNTVTAPQSVEFHIAKPSGFPKGNYKVDISIDGKAATSKDFSVK